MSGHSMVIKKTGDDQYSFFDPDTGRTDNLTAGELADKIDSMMDEGGYTNMAFIDGKKYVKSLGYEVTEITVEDELEDDHSVSMRNT